MKSIVQFSSRVYRYRARGPCFRRPDDELFGYGHNIAVAFKRPLHREARDFGGEKFYEMNATVEPPRIETREAFLVAGFSRRFSYEQASEIAILWQSFAPQIGRVPGQIGSVAYGVTCDAGPAGFDYMAAVEVKSFADVAGPFQSLRIPEHAYAVFAHRGHVSGIHTTMCYIHSSWLPGSEYVADDTPSFERYGAEFDPKTGSGTIEIFVPIIAKTAA